MDLVSELDAGTPGSTGAPVDIANALVIRAQSGDAAAFEQLYRRHVDRVYGLCLRMTGRVDVAEDCTQETFVRAWRNLGRFEGRSAFATWLHRIAVNEVLSRARRAPAGREVDDPHEVLDDLQTRDRETDPGKVLDMESAIRSLPQGARHVLVMQAIYGYSHEETASMLGVAVGTCKAQLHRARQLLRARLGLEDEPA